MTEIGPEKCRTCLTNAVELVSLAADHVACEKVMSVSELIMLCSSVKICIGDDFPQFVCIECVRSAEKSYSFRLLCEESDKSLKETLITEVHHVLDIKNDCSSDEEAIEETFIEELPKEEVIGTVKIEIVPKDLSDEECEIVSVKQESTVCSICDLDFPTAAALNKHLAVHCVTPKYYQCGKCTVRFISEDLLKKHMYKHDIQSTKSQQKPRKKGVKCVLCYKYVPTILDLRQHIRSHEREMQAKNPAKELHIRNEAPSLTEMRLKTQEIRASLLKKMVEKKNERLECSFCKKNFTSVNGMKKHLQTHKIKKYRCQHCFMVFVSANSFKMHMDKHRPKDDVRHKKTMQNKVIYKCRNCNDEFNTLSLIKDHLANHDVQTKAIFQHLRYKCVECGLEHETIYEYFQHSSTHHRGDFSEENLSKKPTHECDICLKPFPSPSALINHQKTHESQWPKKCKYCEVMINTRADYMPHLNGNHEELKTFICTICGKRFFKERNLQSHVKIHSGERNYMCDVCGFSFHAQNNLIAHRRIHTGLKPYKCTYCPQSFSQHAGLRSHMLNHTGEKKYECNICQKKFLRISSQKNHMKTHTGAKDYACHLCNKRFGASSTRKKHMLTHTGERNHVCDFCGKAFSRRSNLNVHRKIHTGETPHVCEICGKGFIQLHVLRSHRNTHRKQQQVQQLYVGSGMEVEMVGMEGEMTGVGGVETVLTEPSEELTVLVDLSQ